MIVVMAVCISQGLIGGHTGHYVTGVPFGTVLFACLGACWGERYWEDRIRSNMESLALPIQPYAMCVK